MHSFEEKHEQSRSRVIELRVAHRPNASGSIVTRNYAPENASHKDEIPVARQS
jgi:hypothetical protein